MDAASKTPRITRREFTLGALSACALVGLGAASYMPATPTLRPPGGQDEQRFLRACIHCEKCREVCPHGAISPAHIEQGLLSIRTPRMDFKRGWCDFCAGQEHGPRCAEVCPTGALRPSGAGQDIIGTAILTRDWCLAARGMGCHECVDHCDYGALELGHDHVPIVKAALCNGCGACELACISLSAGSITQGATDRAITVHPLEQEEIRPS